MKFCALIFAALLLCFVCLPVMAEEQSTFETPPQMTATPFTVAVNAALFETWVITKYGVTLSYNVSPENVYELSYSKGSLGFGYFGFDLGRIEEQKASILWRSYSDRKSLSFFAGMTYNVFNVHLGNDYLETVTGSDRANVDLEEITTLGATWGLGQRWHTEKGFVWGVDWFNITLPLVVLKESTPFTQASNSSQKRENVSEAAKIFKRIPEVGILKLQFGYTF